MSNILLVFVGGGLGAVCRYIVTTMVGSKLGSDFPYGTLTVNAVGSFIIGLITFYFLFKDGGVPTQLRLLTVVGFLGGFTTFSSFALETFNLGQEQLGLAMVNVLANVVLVIVAVSLGMLAAKYMA